jgi:hypothetical protein
MAEPLLEIHRRTGARLSVISSGHASLGPLGAMIDRIEWAGGLAEDTLAGWDVGLMPVPPGLYERGKSGYKLLQYGAAGLPAVASPVGVNRSLAGAMGSPSPSTPGEWVDAVTDLLHAPEEHRRALGERAADVVQNRFSYDGWAGRWKDAVQP